MCVEVSVSSSQFVRMSVDVYECVVTGSCVVWKLLLVRLCTSVYVTLCTFYVALNVSVYINVGGGECTATDEIICERARVRLPYKRDAWVCLEVIVHQ